MQRTSLKSFTLVELLIVIAILAVLAAAVVIVLNPAELLAQSRDTQRISDANMMKRAIELFIVDNPTASLGASQKIYISLPDTSSSCATYTTLPTLPVGWSYNCVTAANLRSTNGTGWLPLDFSSVKGGSPIPYLPTDPQNDATLTKYYQYIPGTNTFELTTLLESEKQSKAAAKDGGTDAGRLEIGSDISLWRTASGLSGYWSFEGSGGITNGQPTGLEDLSGSGNNGTAVNTNGSGMSFVAGDIGNGVQMDGSDDYVDVGQLSTTGSFSIAAWVYTNNLGTQKAVMAKGTGATTNYCLDLRNGDNSVAFFIYDGGGIARGLTGTTPLKVSTGQWTHVAGVYNASVTPNFQAFVNGVSTASTNWTGVLASSPTSAQIGARAAGSPFPGVLDEVRIYNRALSNAEVKAIYNSGK